MKGLRAPKTFLGSVPGLTGKLPHQLGLRPPPGSPLGPSPTSRTHSRTEDRQRCGGGA